MNQRLLLLAALTACTTDTPERRGPTARDSAGIRIVENTTPLWREGEAWRLSPEPMVDIGDASAGEDYELYLVEGAVRLPNGRIVVANRGSGELRFYDSRGRHIFNAGRRGAGPGEFEAMGRPRLLAEDSLVVPDGQAQRVSVFTTGGVFVRSFFLQDNNRRYRVVGNFADGSVLLAGGIGFAGGTSGLGVVRDSVLYIRKHASGDAVDTVGMFPWEERYITRTGEVRSVTGLPFGKTAQAAVGDDRFYFGTADDTEIRVYDPSGVVTRLIRFTHEDLELTKQDIDRYVRDALAAMSERGQRYWRNRFADTPFPNAMPPYGSFLVDDDQNLWVEEYRRPWDEPPRYWVFDPDGQLLGTVVIPGGFQVYQVGTDFVLGESTDDLDVEHVQLYDLIKPEG